MYRGALISMLVLLCAAGAAEGQLQHRPDVAGTNAAVVADHPLAAAAGADVLRRGGNAIDAAITMAAVLAVVRPHLNGVGGDAVLLYRDARIGRVWSVNGSGRAPEAATPEAFRQRGLDTMPADGVLSVTVPGAVRLWADALRRFGTLTMAEALEPAARIAEAGVPVSQRLAADLVVHRGLISGDPALSAVFLPGGRLPALGSLLRQPDLARTLRTIARDGPDAFYVGVVGRSIDGFMAAEGGLLRLEDLAGHSSAWQEPLSTTYRGFHVLTAPPVSQGLALLLQLNMAEAYDLSAMGHNGSDYIHTLAQISRFALAERDRYVTDPAFTEIPLATLVSREFAGELNRRMLAGEAVVDDRAPEDRDDGVYLAVIDHDGNMVSMMQSLASPFGSGRMVPGTGIVLHNRGAAFSLDGDDVRVIAPRKRAYHSMSPAIVLRPDGSALLAFGAPGGNDETPALVQVLNNIVLFGMTPQLAVEAPRWNSPDGQALRIENSVRQDALDGLVARNYTLRLQRGWAPELGGAQVIMRLPGGVRLVGGGPGHEGESTAW
jgi:gamma-glutamyltranspeptidase / glutathione hydrolase